ncbi:DUF6891 domain-containing protein [Yinghuangia sp. YIM S10712]|uniref:DUF6891 domain-containing protein n=1 Tax=Yinghuangia sp. YIM S10712 TaxID=3436930 RepID=UPI003F53C22C
MSEMATPEELFGSARSLRIQDRAYEILATDAVTWSDTAAPELRPLLPDGDAPVWRAVLVDEGCCLLGSVAVVRTRDAAAAHSVYGDIHRAGTRASCVAFLEPPDHTGFAYPPSGGNWRSSVLWRNYIVLAEVVAADGHTRTADLRPKDMGFDLLTIPIRGIRRIAWAAPAPAPAPVAAPIAAAVADDRESEPDDTAPHDGRDDELSDEEREYVVGAVSVMVRGGFKNEADILEDLPHTVCELLGRDHAGLTEELTLFTSELFRSEKAAEAAWHDVTTNDAIDRAFADLRAERIVALQNAGLTQSDGWSDGEEAARSLAFDLEWDADTADIDDEAREAAADSRWGPVRGAVFYHGQDLARAVHGEGLYLAFGAFAEPGRARADHDAASAAVGHTVREVLARHGVAVEWDETAGQRLFVPPFAWRRRRWTRAPAR